MNWLISIHLLLVKTGNAAETKILFNLTHSVLTPSYQGGAPTYHLRSLQRPSFTEAFLTSILNIACENLLQR